MTPLFSIVMPVLNAMPYLEQALASVLREAGPDTEVLVIDGGSGDGTVALLEALAPAGVSVCRSGGSRAGAFQWRSEPDSGQSSALNKGFALARGAYLLWINGDDLLLPGTLDQARAFLAGHPQCQWLAGNLVYIDAQGRLLRCARDGAWRDCLFRGAPVRVYGPTSIFSRALFERVGGFDESLYYLMDTDLWLRFKAAGARFERLPHYCWAFRVHARSKTSDDLRGARDPRIAAERARVYAKNDLRVTGSGVGLQRLWRLVNGSYFRAAWDTCRRRGESLQSLSQ